MALFRARKAEKKYHVEAVIDAGSRAARALIFQREGGGTPVISKKMLFPMPDDGDGVHTAARLHEIIGSLKTDSGILPKKVTFCTGPNISSFSFESWDATVPKKTSVLTAQEGVRVFEDLVKTRSQETPVFRAYPLRVSVNGYPVWPNPEESENHPVRILAGPRGAIPAMMTFQVLMISLPDPIAEFLKSMQTSWGGMSIEFVSLPIAYAAARRPTPDFPDPLIIDAGEKETTVMRMQDGVLRGLEVFSAGPQDAGAWKTMLTGMLDRQYRLGPVTGNVFVGGDGSALPEIASAICAGDWTQRFSPVGTVSVRMLRGESFFGGSSLGGFLAGPEDARLAAILSYALNHRHLFS